MPFNLAKREENLLGVEVSSSSVTSSSSISSSMISGIDSIGISTGFARGMDGGKLRGVEGVDVVAEDDAGVDGFSS